MTVVFTLRVRVVKGKKKKVALPALLALKHNGNRYSHFVGGYAKKSARFIHSTAWNKYSRLWNLLEPPLPVTILVQ